MSYRDDDEGLRARVETLEEELGEARATISRLQGESAGKELAAEKPSWFLGAPSQLKLERELPFEIADEGYEAIAELLRTRLPFRGEVAQVGRTLTYSFRGNEVARVTRVGTGKTQVRIQGDHRGHNVLLVVFTVMASFLGLGGYAGVAQSVGWSPATLVFVLPLLLLGSFGILRALVAGSVNKDRQKLAGVLESIAELAARHAVPVKTRIADAPAADYEAALEEAEEEDAAENLAER